MPQPERIGYDFIGWTGSNGTTPEKNVTLKSGSMGDKHYTANWERKSYTITATAGEGGIISPASATVYYGEDYTFNIAASSGYSISSISVDGSDTTATTAYTFKDVKADHTIDVTFEQSAYEFKLTDTLESGKKYVIVSGTSALTNNTKTSSSTGGGTVGSSNSSNIGSTTVTITDDIITTGEERIIWEYIDNKLYTYVGDVTYTLGITNSSSVQLGLKSDSTSQMPGNQNQNINTNITVSYNDTIVITTGSAAVKKATYYLTNSSGPSMQNGMWKIDTTKLGSVQIYGEYDYTVTFDSNGAASGVLKQGFSAGETKALVANKFVREGYTFMGWSTTKDGSVEYADGANYTATGDATLYAVWQSDYEVTFDANGGEGTMSVQKFKPNVAQKLASNEFTNGEYFFIGWSTTKNGEVEYENGASYTATADITLYAKWAEGVSYTVRHWQQTLTGGDDENSDNYVLMSGDTQTLKGAPSGEATPSTLTYTGFVSPSRKTVKVYEDGSTVVDYYYKRELYYVDLNAVVNGTVYNSCAINGNILGTADFYVNGELILSGTTDVWSQWRYGSTYEFKNITASSNCRYDGLNTSYSTGELSGTITKPTYIYLNYTVVNKFNGWITLSMSSWTSSGGNTDYVDVKSHHGGTLSAKSSSSSVSASVSGTRVNISGLNNLSVGSKVTITVTSSETAIYKSASANYIITIGEKPTYACKCSECPNTVSSSGALCDVCSSREQCEKCSGYVCEKHCPGHTSSGVGTGGGGSSYTPTPTPTPEGDICGTCGGDGLLPCPQKQGYRAVNTKRGGTCTCGGTWSEQDYVCNDCGRGFVTTVSCGCSQHPGGDKSGSHDSNWLTCGACNGTGRI